MKKVLLASLLAFSVEGLAAECGLDSDWDILQSSNGQLPFFLSDVDTISLRLTPLPGAPRNHEIYMSGASGESFICNSEEVTDAHESLPPGLALGSFPRVSCTFTHDRELMQFTAILVKDGAPAAQRCASDFFEFNPHHPFFNGGAPEMADGCYGPSECLIYWRVESLDYTTHENTGQGTGGSDGGNTGQ